MTDLARCVYIDVCNLRNFLHYMIDVSVLIDVCNDNQVDCNDRHVSVHTCV